MGDEVSTESGSDRVYGSSDLDGWGDCDPVATAPGTDSMTVDNCASRRLRLPILNKAYVIPQIKTQTRTRTDCPLRVFDSAIDLSYKTDTPDWGRTQLHTTRLYIIRIVIISGALICVLIAACTRQPAPVGPKFSGRLLLLAGENTNGADLFELSAAPTGSTYNYSIVTRGVFEATGSPDRTRLLYATKDEIVLRDLRTGAVKTLAKGENFCLAWSPDGNRFSYKQKSPAQTRLYVSDLDGKAKLIWEDPFANYGAASSPGQSPVLERAAGSSGCPKWIAPDRFIFDRLLGVLPKQEKSGVALKPNTTTLVMLSDPVKLVNTVRKWSIESVCQVGSAAILRQADQNPSILIAKSLDHLETLNPSPAPCSGCRFVGFAAHSCVPFFIEEVAGNNTEVFSLNPFSWQRQRGTRLSQTFSAAATMLINSSARLMIAGDVPASLILIDTETGETVPFFGKSTEPPASDGKLRSPVPVVWIEK